MKVHNFPVNTQQEKTSDIKTQQTPQVRSVSERLGQSQRHFLFPRLPDTTLFLSLLASLLSAPPIILLHNLSSRSAEQQDEG